MNLVDHHRTRSLFTQRQSEEDLFDNHGVSCIHSVCFNRNQVYFSLGLVYKVQSLCYLFLVLTPYTLNTLICPKEGMLRDVKKRLKSGEV